MLKKKKIQDDNIFFSFTTQEAKKETEGFHFICQASLFGLSKMVSK